MGSKGETDRKRRHFSSMSPTAVAAKKQPFLPISEEKKVWSFFVVVDVLLKISDLKLFVEHLCMSFYLLFFLNLKIKTKIT